MLHKGAKLNDKPVEKKIKTTTKLLGIYIDEATLDLLQVELKFFHEYEARAVDFLCFLLESEMRSKGL